MVVLSPLKPVRAEPVFWVKVPVVVSVPEPLNMPLSVILPPLPAVGLFPRGRLQVELTVLIPAVWVNVTRLNKALLHDSVADVVLPKFTVPPLALKVAAALKVNALLKLVVPDDATKVEAAFTVYMLLKAAPLGTVMLPPV